MFSPVIRFDRGGVFLPELGLWFDAPSPQHGPEIVFVSHAHSDHAAVHREIIVSEPTSQLMHARLSGTWQEHLLPYERATLFRKTDREFRLTLLPAGHVFGSAMALVETNEGSLLYTGDFKLRPGLSAEKCQPDSAAGTDLLIMETTYGRPGYRFPPTAEVMQGVIRFCTEALDNDETPVLLGYSLGKSQEILCALGDARLPIMLHGQVYKLTRIYEQFGQCFPPYTKYDTANARGKVLLCPPHVANSAMLRNLGRVRSAILTGWAVDPSCRYRYQADAAFPLSDHADFNDLVEMVQRVRPKKILTLHGFAADFAQTLRDLGFDAQALSEEDQLALPLAVPPARNRTRSEPGAWFFQNSHDHSLAGGVPLLAETPPESANSFHRFATTCAAIVGTSRKLEKVQLLADYLGTLDPEALGLAAVWFTGHPFAPSQNKVLQLGWAIIRDALCTVAALNSADFGQVYLKHSDLGETAFEILLKLAPEKSHLTLSQVAQLFQQVHAATGPLAKLPLLVRALKQTTALEGKYLVKVLTGDLRIGLKEGLVEEAIAAAFQAPLDEVKTANLLLGHIGETAQLAKSRALQSASLVPFRPVKFMLASPEETAADIWKRVETFGGGKQIVESSAAPQAWIEDKYDGIRCQLHKVGDRVALYSRDLKEITATFFDLADFVRAMPGDFVLDGEIVAMRGEEILPFAELQRRLGRREGDLFLSEEIPIQYIAFDLLWADGQSHLNAELQLRRRRLEALEGRRFRLAQITTARCVADIDEAFRSARERGNEGLMIKDPASEYTPGRRGLAWLKLKRPFATLDCVVVGAEFGHGKRKDVLSDYTFAVRDEKNGGLKVIGKAYTGLTDEEIAQLTRHFLSTARRQHGRYFEVAPDTVLEIAFDSIQASARHDSGLALRFPRIVRIRTDKTPAQIDTLETAMGLVRKKQNARSEADRDASLVSARK
jgi:DNA ligase 1